MLQRRQGSVRRSYHVGWRVLIRLRGVPRLSRVARYLVINMWAPAVEMNLQNTIELLLGYLVLLPHNIVESLAIPQNLKRVELESQHYPTQRQYHSP